MVRVRGRNFLILLKIKRRLCLLVSCTVGHVSRTEVRRGVAVTRKKVLNVRRVRREKVKHADYMGSWWESLGRPRETEVSRPFVQSTRMAGSKCLQSDRAMIFNLPQSSPKRPLERQLARARAHHPQRCASNCTLSAGTPTGGRIFALATTTRFGKMAVGAK